MGEIVHFLEEFHANSVFPKGTNSSFISLISKIDIQQNLGDYRPISLVGCMYKIVSKILASRMKRVLGKIIDLRQSAFMGDRNLLHSVVVENEVVDEARRKKKETSYF